MPGTAAHARAIDPEMISPLILRNSQPGHPPGKQGMEGTEGTTVLYAQRSCEGLQLVHVIVKLYTKANVFANHHSIHKINDYVRPE